MKTYGLPQGPVYKSPLFSLRIPLNALSEGGRLHFLKQRSGFRLISLAATSLLCVLLASVIAPKGSSNRLMKKKPSVVLQASTTSITLPCPPDAHSISDSCPSTSVVQVGLTAVAKDFNEQLTYAYAVTGGRVAGEGRNATWDLNGVWPGFYTATVEVQHKKKHRALSSVDVKIMTCSDCVPACFLCPIIVVDCPDEVKVGTPAIFTFRVSPLIDLASIKWTARDSDGEDVSERIIAQGTSISIRTDGLGGRNVTATVEVEGIDLSCGRTASCSILVKP